MRSKDKAIAKGSYYQKGLIFDLQIDLQVDKISIRLLHWEADQVYHLDYQLPLTKQTKDHNFNIESIFKVFKKPNKNQDQYVNFKIGQKILTTQGNWYKVHKGGKMTIYVQQKNPKYKKGQLNLNLQLVGYLSPMQREVHALRKERFNYNKSKQECKNCKNRNSQNKQKDQINQKYIQINQKVQNKLSNKDKVINLQQMWDSLRNADQKEQKDKHNNEQKNKILKFGSLDCNKSFIVNNSKIMYNRQKYYTQFLCFKQILMGEVFIFKIKIVKTVNSRIMVGVIDLYRQQKRHAFCYSGWDKMVYPDRKREGPGFKQQSIVEVRIDRTKGLVMWGINKQYAYSKSSVLCDKNRTFVPYFEMSDKQDVVEWL